MAYNVKSKEFADAWRIVSESLLAMIQQGEFTFPIQPTNNLNVNTQSGGSEVEVISNPITNNSPTPQASRTPVQTMFCTNPTKNEDGSYSFKRMQSERNSTHFYRIFIYDDESCEFELCSELARESECESLQNLRDSKASSMPNSVCQVVEGSINSQVNSIQIACRGTGHKSGRLSMQVNSPCKVIIK